MAKKKVAEKWSVGDRVMVPVEFVITAIGAPNGEDGKPDESKAEAALVPVEAHVNHIHMKVAEIPG